MGDLGKKVKDRLILKNNDVFDSFTEVMLLNFSCFSGGGVYFQAHFDLPCGVPRLCLFRLF